MAKFSTSMFVIEITQTATNYGVADLKYTTRVQCETESNTIRPKAYRFAYSS
jgi:hypothetical protein